MHSHMSLSEEGDYVRVVIITNDDGIPHLAVYPLKAFRGPADKINDILFPQPYLDVTESFKKYGQEGVELEYNLILNKAFKEMHDKGTLIVAEDIEVKVLTHPEYSQLEPMVYSNDGYVSIYPSNPPPPNSKFNH